MRRRALLLMIALAIPTLAAAIDGVRPFTGDSFAKIVSARTNRPFVVAFWSVNCAHCPAELRALGELRGRYPQLDIVLVATDTPDDVAAAARLAKGYGLGSAEQWLFADAIPERLYISVDRGWHGELPRTYFFDKAHQVEAVSGVISPDKLESRVREHLR